MQSSLRQRNILTLLFIITGSASYFTSKMQNIQPVVQADVRKPFFHPYMQTLCMFIGQFGCLFVFFFFRWQNPELYQERSKEALISGKKPINIWQVFIPASCDFVASAMSYTALNFVPGSVYQMLKGGGIITTAIFSYLLFKKRIKRNHISGCILALIGITIVGAGSLTLNGSSGTSTDIGLEVLGYILLICSLIFRGFFYTYEQKIFNEYYVEPLQMIGIEGIFGICYCLIFIPILTFVPCPFQYKSCVISDGGGKFIERPQMYFSQIAASTVLSIMVPLGIVAVGSFNINGLSITKHVNALARSLLNMTKTVVIWGIGLIVTLTAGRDSDMYKWEKTNTWGIIVQAIGFTILVVATLIYNENIWVPHLSQPKTIIEDKRLLLEESK